MDSNACYSVLPCDTGFTRGIEHQVGLPPGNFKVGHLEETLSSMGDIESHP